MLVAYPLVSFVFPSILSCGVAANGFNAPNWIPKFPIKSPNIPKYPLNTLLSTHLELPPQKWHLILLTFSSPLYLFFSSTSPLPHLSHVPLKLSQPTLVSPIALIYLLSNLSFIGHLIQPNRLSLSLSSHLQLPLMAGLLGELTRLHQLWLEHNHLSHSKIPKGL